DDLLLRHGRDEQAERQVGDDVDERHEPQRREASLHGDAEHEDREQQDGRQVDAREHEVGHHFRYHDVDGAHGRYEQHFHRTHLLFADDGYGGHHGADKHHDEAHDAGNEVVGRLHLRVVEELHLRED